MTQLICRHEQIVKLYAIDFVKAFPPNFVVIILLKITWNTKLITNLGTHSAVGAAIIIPLWMFVLT